MRVGKKNKKFRFFYKKLCHRQEYFSGGRQNAPSISYTLSQEQQIYITRG